MLLLFDGFGGFEFVECGQIEDDSVLKTRLGFVVDETLQHDQRLTQSPEIDETYGDVVLGLEREIRVSPFTREGQRIAISSYHN